MKIYYQCLRGIYNTQTKTYRGLPHMNTQNIEILMTEIYKCLNKITPAFLHGITKIKKVITTT